MCTGAVRPIAECPATAAARDHSSIPSCDRRAFLLTAISGAAILLPACASVSAYPVRAEAGVVRLLLRDHAALAVPGGHLRIRPDTMQTPVHVLYLDTGYIAISPICQHLGCIVEFEGSRFVCPCHGSMYDRDGSVLRGPTERALVTFPTEVTADGSLLIRIGAQ